LSSRSGAPLQLPRQNAPNRRMGANPRPTYYTGEPASPLLVTPANEAVGGEGEYK
jgi:hypothetical protein